MSTELSLIFLIIGILLFFSIVVRFIQHWQWKISGLKRIIGTNNAAAGLEFAGFLFGVFIIISSVLNGISLHKNQMLNLMETGSASLWSFAITIECYGMVGVLVLLFLGQLGMHLLLHLNIKAAVRSNNIAAAVKE